MDGLHYVDHELVYTYILFCTGLKVLHIIVLSHLLRICLADLTLIVHVYFIANEYLAHVLVCFSVNGL